MIESSKKVKPWREAVLWAVLNLIRGPVTVDITFSLVRPKSAKKGARSDKKPDIDKLLRSTFDALSSAGVFEDDARIVRVLAVKRYAGDPGALPVPGAVIFVEAAR